MKELLRHITHRPFPIPTSSWKYYQEWNQVVFLHLKVSKEYLRRFVPKKLELDDYHGQCYISIVLFTMENVRPRFLPGVNFISYFHELNIRTYVKSEGKSGVYFLNIEGEKSISCFLAKTLSGLNYKKSHMFRQNNIYQSKNKKDNSAAYLKYKIGEALNQKTTLDRWLTERYCMYNVIDGKKYRYDIHHIEWPIQSLHVEEASIHYPLFDIQIENPDTLLMHYSPGVQVIAWDKVWV